jgi:hypothetical protein
MDPSLLDPVMDLLRSDAQFVSQLGNSPFVPSQQFVAEILADQTQFPHQGADSPFGKDAAAAGWDETLGVEPGGDGAAVQPFPLKFFQPLGESLVVLQLLVPAYRTSHLMPGRQPTFPDDRHVGELGRLVRRDHHAFDQAARDLLAIQSSGTCSMPERGDVLRQRLNPFSVRRTERGRQFRQEAVILFFQLALFLQGLFPTRFQRSRHQSILRLYGVILSLGPTNLVLCAFELLTPLVVQTLPLLLDVLDGAETEFQRSRFQSA